MWRGRLISACAAATALAAAVGAAPASGASFPGTLAIGQPAVDRATGALVYSATATVTAQCAPGEFCGWFPFVTTVPAAEACRPASEALVWARSSVFDDGAGRLPQSFAPTWREWPAHAGSFRRACLYVYAGSEILAAEATFEIPGGQGDGGPQPPPPGDGSDIPRTAIPRSVGVRCGFAYRLSTANIPPGVDRARFLTLARAGARRWGLRGVGTTRSAPRERDGTDTIGFARDVPRDALGVTRIRSLRYYRRLSNGRLRFSHERVLERDLSLAYGVDWHAGPGAPPADRVDLQTVLIHELGHFAGNDHVRNCANSPMWVGLRPGEWWWTRADWYQQGCSNAPRGPAVATAASGRRGAATRVPLPAARPLLVERDVRRIVLG